jgi:hypothetical protein
MVVVSFRLRPLCPRTEFPLSNGQKNEPLLRLFLTCCGKKTVCSRRELNPVLQQSSPYASHYTDWAMPDQTYSTLVTWLSSTQYKILLSWRQWTLGRSSHKSIQVKGPMGGLTWFVGLMDGCRELSSSSANFTKTNQHMLSAPLVTFHLGPKGAVSKK